MSEELKDFEMSTCLEMLTLDRLGRLSGEIE